MAFLLLLSACSGMATQPPTHIFSDVHPGGAQRIAFSPSGRWLASGGLHGEVIIWSVADGTESRRLAAHRSAIRGLVWRDEAHLVSVDKTGELRLQNVRTGAAKVRDLSGPVQAMVSSPEGSRLLVGQGSRVLWVDALSLGVESQYDINSKVISVAVDASGTQIAIAAADGRVQLADADLSHWRELERPPSDANDLQFSPDGRTLLGGGWFRLWVWNVNSGALRTRSTEHLGQVISVDVSPDAQYWVSLGRQTDSSVYLVDAQSNRMVRRLKAHELCGWQVRFSPDGRYAASAGEEGSIHIYDLDVPYRPVTVWGVETE